MALSGFLRCDVRYAARALWGAPIFTAVAVATLALGIGANTAIFSVVDSVLLEPLAYPRSEELVSIQFTTQAGPDGANGSLRLPLSASMFFTFAEQNRTFAALGVWGVGRRVVTGFAEPEEVDTVTVSEGVLEALGVPPVLGRWLSAEDQRANGPAVAMIAYDYWQRRFGGDPAVLERTMTVDGVEMAIVGVMPPRFRIANANPDLIAPFRLDRSRAQLPPFFYRGIARLKAGATLAEANADLVRMLTIWLATWPPPPGGDARVYEAWGIGPDLHALKEDVVGDVDDVLWAVLGTLTIVLLIACANVVTLLLVRADGRRHDFAVRAALGAGAWRVSRQMLAESLLLALVGGALGVALAFVAVRLLLAIAPQGLPRLDEIALDAQALGFALLASSVAGLASGVLPALVSAGPRLSASLRSVGGSVGASRERQRSQSLLVVGQVALALVLLVSSGLMIRSFQALRSVHPGFTNAATLQTFRMTIPPLLVTEPDRVLRMEKQILDALAAIPGVESAGFTTSMPLEGAGAESNSIAVEDQSAAVGDSTPPTTRFKFVSPGLLGTAGTQIVAGRDITWDDVYAERLVAMVGDSLARDLWGTPLAALGKSIAQGEGLSWREVVGVVQDVRDDSLEAPAPLIAYWPPRIKDHWLAGDFVARRVTVVIRSDRAGTESFINEIQRALWSVNASIPVASARTMDDLYRRSLAPTTFTLLMLVTAGAMALLLGVVGVYGVISYGVSRRSREIAVRSALGESPSALVRRFIRHGLALAAAGIVLGLGVAACGAHLLASLLFDVAPVDPLVYVGAALVLAAATALASYVPARRAARVDPMAVLRRV